jgi:hypothetical protein
MRILLKVSQGIYQAEISGVLAGMLAPVVNRGSNVIKVSIGAVIKNDLRRG